MKKLNFEHSKSFFVIAIIDLLLIIAVLGLMRHVQFLLAEDARLNLTEIVTQNKNVITSNLTVALNNLELHSKQLAERLAREEQGGASMERIFSAYAQEKGDTSLNWASDSGKGLSGAGVSVDIAGRQYFKLGMQGIPNISDRLVSRINGEDIFVLCVPILYKGQVIGTIQKQYTPQDMYNLCSASLFADQGSTYILNSQGYILISAQQSQYTRESDNYYRILYLNNPDVSRKLEADIQKHNSGFMQAVINGETVFFTYTPIEQIYDWFLISSISTKAISPNANIIVRMFYVVLLATMLFFTFSTLYYVQQKRKQQLHLENIAFVDPFTEGNYLTKFTVDLQNILAANKNINFCLCSFDIDNFKYINSYYSFHVGNSILKTIYQRYSKQLTPLERIARVNSDHFVMLLEDVSPERLNALFDAELSIGDIKIYISAGLYRITNRMESVNLMLDKASIAAKKIKGLHYKHLEFYSEDFDREIAHNEQMKRAIEQALEDDEIEPFFQPKADIRTRALVGAEALARWRNKEGRLIPPGEFIPVCEKTGLIAGLDFVVFEKTLQFLQHNLQKGIACTPISVNFSRIHLLNGNFLETLLEKLAAYNVPPELVELELTETVLFDNHRIVANFINNLHANGLKISMDDFGSGYSSLHMLKNMDIDVLKIDRGFLLDTENNNRQKAVFGAITQMAKNLNMQIVVEGVETQENLDLMMEFACYTAQGYYFAKPMDAVAFQKIYEDGKV